MLQIGPKQCLPDGALAMPRGRFAMCVLVILCGITGLLWLLVPRVYRIEPGLQRTFWLEFGPHLCFVIIFIFLIITALSGLYLSSCRREIRKNLFALWGREATQYSLNWAKKFGHSDFVNAGFFPNQAALDFSQDHFMARYRHIDFSQFAIGRVGANRSGAPNFSLLKNLLFFRMEIGDAESDFMLLPGAWKRQFGWWNAIKFMGYWRKALPKIATESFPGLFLYGQKISPEMTRVVAALQHDLEAPGGMFYLSLHHHVLYLAIPSVWKTSLLSETKNRATLAAFQQNIHALVTALTLLEQRFSGEKVQALMTQSLEG